MKTTKIFYLFSLCLLMIHSCHDDRSGKYVDPNNYDGDIAFDELVEDISIIYLNGSNKAVFNNADRIIFHDSMIYVLDREVHKQVLVFDEKGNFSHSIGEEGHGPGEYVEIMDFAINEKEDEVIILTRPSVVLTYSLSGEHIQTKEIAEVLIHNLAYYKKGFIGTTNHSTYTEQDDASLIYYFDHEFNIIKEEHDVLSDYISTPSIVSPALRKYGDLIYFVDMFSPSLYLIHPDSLGSRQYKMSIKSYNKPNEWGTDFFTEKISEITFMSSAFYNNNSFNIFLMSNEQKVHCNWNLETDTLIQKKYNMYFPNVLSQNENNLYVTYSDLNYIKKENSIYYKYIKDSIHLTDHSSAIILKIKLREDDKGL